MMYRCSNILSVLFKLHQRSARRIAIVTLLADPNLMQVRTWCRSALLSSQEDVNWQMYFLVPSMFPGRMAALDIDCS